MSLTPLLMLMFGLASRRCRYHPTDSAQPRCRRRLPGLRRQAARIKAISWNMTPPASARASTTRRRARIFSSTCRRGSAQMVVPQLNSVVNAPDVSGLTQQITDAGHNAHFTLLGAGHICRHVMPELAGAEQPGHRHRLPDRPMAWRCTLPEKRPWLRRGNRHRRQFWPAAQRGFFARPTAITRSRCRPACCSN